MTAPAATTGNHVDQDLMTRRQVAYLFRVTPPAVASWARRGQLLEVRNQAGRPRYPRTAVEALFLPARFQAGGVMTGTSITINREEPATCRSRHCGPARRPEHSLQPATRGSPGKRSSP
jgi:hypothetical protein